MTRAACSWSNRRTSRRGDIPGGSVDEGEAPWATATRELHEELGIERRADRLLVIDHEAAADGYPEAMAYIFDGGTISADEVAELNPTDPEIVTVGLYSLNEMSGKLKPVLARRLTVALDVARVGNGLALCNDGERA